MRTYSDFSGEFWPQGWMVWACWALAAIDAGLIATVIRLALRHAA